MATPMTLGFCGLGLMGSAMVQRLLASGHQVKVWNRTPDKAKPLIEQGALWCDTPAQAAQGVDGVLMCLMNAESVESVVFGPQGIAQSSDLQWLVDHASIAPQITRQLAARLRDTCHADWLDAPVSGGVAGVQAGSLAVMVGGAPTHLAAVRQAVSAYAGRVTHMGESGAGQATKLCNQIIVASTVAAIAEAVSFAERNHIDTTQLAAALTGGWADSKPFQVFVPRMLKAQSPSIGALSTMLKDVDTIMQTAQETQAALPVTSSVQQWLRTAQAMGLGQAELSAMISVLQPERQAEFLASGHAL